MLKIYFEILDSERLKIFDLLKNFSSVGYLSGGTAIALQLKHRYSYDFDIFTKKPISKAMLIRVRDVFGRIETLIDNSKELSFLTERKIKISIIYFPFLNLHGVHNIKGVKIAHIKDLASNKAYTIGRRGEYRDYVDMYFLIRSGIELKSITSEAEKRFDGAFSERLFLQQLVYFEDIKSFDIDFIDKAYTKSEIQRFFENQISNFKT